MEVRANRSKSYVCSLDPMSAVDMEILLTIRRTVKAANAHVRPEETRFGVVKRCKRVSVCGREPIEREYYTDRYGKKRVRGYDWSGNIVGDKYSNSKRLDVYINDDNRWVDYHA